MHVVTRCGQHHPAKQAYWLRGPAITEWSNLIFGDRTRSQS